MRAKRRGVGKRRVAGPDLERQAGGGERRLDMRKGELRCAVHAATLPQGRRRWQGFTAGPRLPIS